VHNNLLSQHNVVHLISTYFKAITNETLLTQNDAQIDGGYIYLTNSADAFNIDFDFGNGLYDPYMRLRKGKMLSTSNGDPLALGTTTTFTFENFSFLAVDTFPENRVTVQQMQLKLNNITANNYTFALNLTDFTFTDTTGTKTIHLSGQFDIEWTKSTDSPYFTDNEMFTIKPNTTFTNYDDFSMEMNTSNAMQFDPDCSLVKGGSATFNITGITPGEGELNFDNQNKCNEGANMTLAEIPFRVGFTDWMIK